MAAQHDGLGVCRDERVLAGLGTLPLGAFLHSLQSFVPGLKRIYRVHYPRGWIQPRSSPACNAREEGLVDPTACPQARGQSADDSGFKPSLPANNSIISHHPTICARESITTQSSFRIRIDMNSMRLEASAIDRSRGARRNFTIHSWGLKFRA